MGPKIMGTQRQRLRATITVTMTPGFFLFSGFISMKENDKKKPRGILRFMFRGKTAKNQGSHLTYSTNQTTSD
jgi:hypothetical protein